MKSSLVSTPLLGIVVNDAPDEYRPEPGRVRRYTSRRPGVVIGPLSGFRAVRTAAARGGGGLGRVCVARPSGVGDLSMMTARAARRLCS
jgi:hypothetical protein